MLRTGLARSLIVGVIVTAVGIVLAALLPVAVHSSVGLLYHEYCGPAGVVASTEFWTPVEFANSPFEGSAKATAVLAETSQARSSLSITASNGSSGALFSLDDWTLDEWKTAYELGPGANQPCDQLYQALDVSRNGQTFASPTLTTYWLLPQGSQSDRFVPHSVTIPGSTFDSVLFNDSFLTSNAVTLQTCPSGGIPASAFASSGTIGVLVPFRVGNETVPVPVDLAEQTTYSYTIQSNATGAWQVDDLSLNQGPTGGGYAFSWSAC